MAATIARLYVARTKSQSKRGANDAELSGVHVAPRSTPAIGRRAKAEQFRSIQSRSRRLNRNLSLSETQEVPTFSIRSVELEVLAVELQSNWFRRFDLDNYEGKLLGNCASLRELARLALLA